MDLEITKEMLGRDSVALHLGVTASLMLRHTGRAAFFVDDGGVVRAANPLYCYFDARCLPDRTYTFTRQIVMEARPIMVALRDGQLWEIELKEEKDAEGE